MFTKAIQEKQLGEAAQAIEKESKKKKEAEEKAAKKKALEPLWKRYIHISIFCFHLEFSSLWLLSVAFPEIKQLLKVK